jgi:cellulose synthase (UDP-forming)
MHLFMVWRLAVRTTPPAPVGATVDVFVPSFNEPVEMLRRTLQAALRIDYPHQTWLLDDGNRPEARALAESPGCRYLTRPENVDAKAGNFNNALKQHR